MAALIGKVDKAYISSINFLDQRDILEQVLDVTSEDAQFLDIMELTGRTKVTDVPEYDHFENTYQYRKGVVSSVDTTYNGNSADERLRFTLTSVEEAKPKRGDLVMFQPNTTAGAKKMGYVLQVTGYVVDVIPLYSGATIDPNGTPIGSNQVVAFFSNTSPEGSSDPESKRPEFKRSRNFVQIFKNSAKITDLQKVSKVEVKYGGKEYIMYKLQHDALSKHRLDMAFAFLTGRKGKFNEYISDGGLTFGSNDLTYTTQGLRHYVLEGDGPSGFGTLTTGGVDKALGGTIDRAAIRDVNRKLDKTGAPKDYFAFAGGDIAADLDEVVTQIAGIKESIDYSAFGTGDARKRAIDLGIDSVRLYGRTWHVKRLSAFDHPEVFAAEAGSEKFNFEKELYLVPTDKIKADASGDLYDRICVRYMSGDGTDLMYMETLTGKLAPNPTSDAAVLQVGYQTVAGLQAVGLRQFAIVRP